MALFKPFIALNFFQVRFDLHVDIKTAMQVSVCDKANLMIPMDIIVIITSVDLGRLCQHNDNNYIFITSEYHN